MLSHRTARGVSFIYSARMQSLRRCGLQAQRLGGVHERPDGYRRGSGLDAVQRDA